MSKDCDRNSQYTQADELACFSHCIDDVVQRSNGSALEINLLACTLAYVICKDKTSEHLKFVIEFLQVLIGLIKMYR